jgi:hypothetical protein
MKYSLSDEQISQSSFSPGVVKDEEDLLRWHFHPEHFKDGNILPAAITTSDLAQNGLSVDRYQYASKERIQEEIKRMQDRIPEKRKFALICKFSCLDVRDLRDEEGGRALMVIDETLENNPAHASIYSAKDRSKGVLRKIRSDLLSLLEKHQNINDVFDPSY